jgi:PKD repeat protein
VKLDGSPVTGCTGIQALQCTPPAGVVESPIPHAWTVTAKDACGAAGTTASWQFTACSAPGAPTNTSPTDGTLVSGNATTLQWSAPAGGAANYDVYLNGTPVTGCTGIQATQCALTNLTETASGYTWYVVAHSACGGVSSPSASTKFVTCAETAKPDGAFTMSPVQDSTITVLGVVQKQPYAGQTVTFTDTSANNPTLFRFWDFNGDGGSGTPVAGDTNKSVTHVFTQGSTSGMSKNVRHWAKNCVGQSPDNKMVVNVYADIRPVKADFDWSPANPQTGQTVTFTAKSGPDYGDPDTFLWSAPQILGSSAYSGNPVAYPFACAGSYDISLTVKRGTYSDTTLAHTVVVTGTTAPGVAANLSPADGTMVQPGTVHLTWDPPQTGTPPFFYKVTVDGTTLCQTNATQCDVPSVPISTDQHTWTVSASNSCGTSTTTALSFHTCDAPGIPVADFKLNVQDQPYTSYPQQLQPFVGQPVTFQDTSTNSPTSWVWFDFQNDPTKGITYDVQNPTHTFTRSGGHNVRLHSTNCAGRSKDVVHTVNVYPDIRPVTADFTWTPTDAVGGTPVTFTAKQGFDLGSPDTFAWDFGDGSPAATGVSVQHTFTCGDSFKVTLTAARSGFNTPGTSTQSVTIGGTGCCKAVGAATNPGPANGATIAGGTVTLTWQRPANGTDPITYDVSVDGALRCADVTTTQCVLTDFMESGDTHVWQVTAKNPCSTTQTPTQWTFKACSQPGPPVADIGLDPLQGSSLASFPDQLQPYVGQPVNLHDLSTNSPTAWNWYDFQELRLHFDVANPSGVVWNSAGTKNVRLKTTNCAGTSAEKLLKVTVYPDIRPVRAQFSWQPASPNALKAVTFIAEDGDDYGNPNNFSWDFGDGTTGTGNPIDHVFACGKHYQVTLTAKRTKDGVSRMGTQPQDVEISGYPCSPLAAMVVDLANELPPTDTGTQKGGAVIFNQTANDMALKLMVRPCDTGAVNDQLPPLTLAPGASLTLPDILSTYGLSFDCATIWVSLADNTSGAQLPVVNAWNYFETTSGAKYGQFLPIFQIWPASSQPTTKWLTGLVHNGTPAPAGGLETVLTIVNPMADAWGSKNGTLTLLKADGTVLRSTGLNLTGYGFKEMPINRWFGFPDAQDLGSLILRVDIPSGVAAVVSSTMVDSASSAAVVIPSQTPQ